MSIQSKAENADAQPRAAIRRRFFSGRSLAAAIVTAMGVIAWTGPVHAAESEAPCRRFLPDFGCDREARPAGHVAPMSMPYLFEDPYITTELNLVGIYHGFPSDSVFEGGDAGVVALQARLALTDRLAFIATKDGYMINSPDNPWLKQDEGFMDISAGFKYAVIDDRARGIIVTPSLRFEIPVGNSDVLQGDGEGVFIPGVSFGWGPKNVHLITDIGAQLPIDKDRDSSSVFYNIHLDQAFEVDFIPGADYIVPFIELNGMGLGRLRRGQEVDRPEVAAGARAARPAADRAGHPPRQRHHGRPPLRGRGRRESRLLGHGGRGSRHLRLGRPRSPARRRLDGLLVRARDQSAQGHLRAARDLDDRLRVLRPWPRRLRAPWPARIRTDRRERRRRVVSRTGPRAAFFRRGSP